MSKPHTSNAYCKLCYNTIDLKSGGSNALDFHQNGQKHQEFEETRKTNSMKLFLSSQFSKSSNVNQKEGPLSHQSSLKSARVGPSEVQEGPLSSFVLDKNTLNAETVWRLNVVKSHQSLRSYDLLKKLFKVIFPDSAIPDKFSLGKDKVIRYMIIYGIYPALRKS